MGTCAYEQAGSGLRCPLELFRRLGRRESGPNDSKEQGTLLWNEAHDSMK